MVRPQVCPWDARPQSVESVREAEFTPFLLFSPRRYFQVDFPRRLASQRECSMRDSHRSQCSFRGHFKVVEDFPVGAEWQSYRGQVTANA